VPRRAEPRRFPPLPLEILSRLSPQQQAICHLLMRSGGSLTASMIAEQVGTTPSTLRKQLQRILALVQTFRDKNVYRETGSGFSMPGRKSGSMEGLEEELDALSGRQQEVLALRRDGKRNREIAQVLGISEATVRVHVHRAKRAVSGRKRCAKYRLTREELEALPSGDERIDYDEAALAYRIQVEKDSPTQRDLKALAIAGVGGSRSRKLLLTERAQLFKQIAASGRERLVRIGENERKLVEDVLQTEFSHLGDGVYVPRSNGATDYLRREIIFRIRMLCEAEQEGRPAIAVRPYPGAAATIVKLRPASKKRSEAAVVVFESGRRWWEAGPEIVRPGDRLTVRDQWRRQVTEWGGNPPIVVAPSRRMLEMLRLKYGDLLLAGKDICEDEGEAS